MVIILSRGVQNQIEENAAKANVQPQPKATHKPQQNVIILIFFSLSQVK